MSELPDNYLVNACEYTPIYFIQDPGITLAKPYTVVAQSNNFKVNGATPMNGNLKSLYESSGSLENNFFVSNANNKSRVLKKSDSNHIGNNLKLASFLVPKNETVPMNKDDLSISNVICPRSVTLNNANTTLKPVTNTINRRILKVQNKGQSLKVSNQPKILTKVKPKKIPPDSTKITSVNLLKLEDTYHSPPILNEIASVKLVQLEETYQSSSVSNEIATVKLLKLGETYSPSGTNETASVNLAQLRETYNSSPVSNEMATVKLLKLGETYSPSGTNETASVNLAQLRQTYNCLGKLSTKHKKIANKPVKELCNTDKLSQEATYEPQETTYDALPNNGIVYKVISPEDLKINEDNKIVIKMKKKESKKYIEDVEQEEAKVTRSGRKVKTPKQMQPDTSNVKQKRRNGNAITCFQCPSVFSNIFHLQKHYESQPTHIPTNFHTNLFVCLLAIVKSSSNDERANMFIKQLEQLIDKIKGLLPCLLKKIDGCEGTPCTINDEIGRIFGMSPGKYNLNMDALTCTKNNEGHCKHNPPKPNNLQSQFTPDQNKPSQILQTEQNDDNEEEIEDCARINSVHSWPIVRKRIWKVKEQRVQNTNAKKIKLNTETEPLIELGNEDLLTLSENSSAINKSQSKTDNVNTIHIQDDSIHEISEKDGLNLIDELSTKPTGNHAQFYSAHFDIRSSPIKPSSSVFCKFQIDVQKLPNYEGQSIRPLVMDNSDSILPNNMVLPVNSDNQLDLQGLLTDIEMPCKDTSDLNQELNFGNSKEWAIPPVPNDKRSEDDSFLKNNNMIEPVLMHSNCLDRPPDISLDQNEHLNHDLTSNQGQSVLNFLDALGNDCLSYPETEIRHNPVVDFNLDLFSFSNS